MLPPEIQNIVREVGSLSSSTFPILENYSSDAINLAYVANVTDKIDGEEYYGRDYEGRLDQICKYSGGDFRLRNHKVHNESERKTDIGKNNENACALVSTKFWYYGKDAKKLSDFGKFPFLTERLGKLQQGYRVNHSEKVKQELVAVLGMI